MSAWLRTKEWYYTKLTIQWSASVIISIIFFIELYIAIKKINETRRKRSFTIKVTLLIICPLLIYISYFSMSFAGLYGDMHWDNQYCYSALISTISYFFAKNFLYQLFVLRLYTIYNASSFQYPIKLLLSISIFAFTACVSWIIWVSLKLEIENQSINGYGCIIYLPFLFNESGAFIDLIISIICLYLFLKPLLSLIKVQEKLESKQEHSTMSPSDTDGSPPAVHHANMYAQDHIPAPAPTLSRSHSRRHEDKDDNMYFVAEKYTLLSVMGIMSSFMILIIVGTVGGGAFIIIDGVINCIVVLLMNERYNNLYIRTCGPFRLCQSVVIQCCCHCTCGKNDGSDEVELAKNMDYDKDKDGGPTLQCQVSN